MCGRELTQARVTATDRNCGCCVCFTSFGRDDWRLNCRVGTRRPSDAPFKAFPSTERAEGTGPIHLTRVHRPTNADSRVIPPSRPAGRSPASAASTVRPKSAACGATTRSARGASATATTASTARTAARCSGTCSPRPRSPVRTSRKTFG